MKKIILATILFASLFVYSCKRENNIIAPEPCNGTLIDFGKIPAAVNIKNIAEFQTAIYNNGYLFVATSNGVWKNNLNTKEWSTAGLQGKSINAIYKHPTIENKFFVGVVTDFTATLKTMYISNDAGITWASANNVIFDSLDMHYENYVCFAARPNNPNHIYANLEGGTMLAVSVDGGMNWVRKNNATESYFGYQSNIAFLPNNANVIYQGSENPLDDAWLGKYDINNANPFF